MRGPKVLQVRNLCFSSPNAEASSAPRVDLEVGRGELYALFGQSGSGKTAILEAILGLRSSVRGEVLVGTPLRARTPIERRAHIAVVWHSPAWDQRLTPESVVRFVARLCQIPSVPKAGLTQLLREGEVPDRRFRESWQALSSAERWRFDMAVARVRQTDVVMLDEPRLGETSRELDESFELIRDYTRRGVAVLLCTKSADVATRADRVGLIERGAKVAEGPVDLVFGTP